MSDPLVTSEVIARTPVERVAQEQALVLRAVDLRCVVQRTGADFELVVASTDATRARAELAAYLQENPAETSNSPPWTDRTDGWLAACVYATVLLGVGIAAERGLGSSSWFALGKANAGLICEGQWWRTITALTLHADRAHLIANLVIGGLFGIFAARQLGSGLAWFGILLGGAGGNALNAWLRPATHSAVGASTAIFAALGLVGAWAWTQRREHPLRKFARWTPLLGAAVLLVFLGGGGRDQRIDVGAHVLGFLCGTALGTAWGKLGPDGPLPAYVQTMLAAVSILLIALAWTVALRHAGPLIKCPFYSPFGATVHGLPQTMARLVSVNKPMEGTRTPRSFLRDFSFDEGAPPSTSVLGYGTYVPLGLPKGRARTNRGLEAGERLACCNRHELARRARFSR